MHLKVSLRRIVVLFLLSGTFLPAAAGKLDRAYKALQIYDYFRAKKLFQKAKGRKTDAYACYGLATIYYRTDNPFHNSDSALRYLNRGWAAWQARPEVKKFGSFSIDEASFRALADSISYTAFRKASGENSIVAFDRFLQGHFLAPTQLRSQAVRRRDELELREIRSINKSDSTATFIALHPGSPVMDEAEALFERQVFEESTRERNAGVYVAFLRKYPHNRMAAEAYEWLYAHYSQKKDVAGLALFVREFPQASQSEEAWKLLFSLTVKAYNYAELKRFLDQYPGFPLKNTILHELELNKLVLYPYLKGEKAGYINEDGDLKISPQFDAAGDFRQGLAVVHRNDSAWFVNKENINPFERTFLEAYGYVNGVAPVQMEDGWYFLNRLGQVISGSFEEVNEISDGIYVVKKNGRYGAVDQFAQQVIAPRFEKLGDFVNGFAYYTEDGTYGFVSKEGMVHPPEYGWLSDFSSWRQAVIKVAGRFGLTDHAGKTVLEPVYDQVLRQNDSIYVVVRGEQYGFFHSSGCFAHFPAFDYISSVQSGKFSNGEQFKLNLAKKQAIADGNGHQVIPFGTFDEVFVESEGFLRFRKKGKFGFADSTGKTLIEAKYDQASDFVNGIALAQIKDKHIIVGTDGSHLFESQTEISRLGDSHFTTGEEPVKIIDNKGAIRFADILSVQQVAPGIFAAERAGGEIRLLYDEKSAR